MNIWIKIAKYLVTFGLKQLFNHVDRNQDGVLSRDEITEFIDTTRKLLSRIKNRNV